MKILMINHYAVPPIESGGTRHYSLAQELIKRGHQVTVIAANFSHQKRVPLIPDVREPVFERHYDEVPFIWVNVPPYTRNSPARAKNMIAFTKAMLINKYFKEMDPPDVVIGSSPHPFAAWAAQRLATKWGIPFIFEVRDLWPQSLIDLGKISSRHPAVKFMAMLEKHLYKRADKIITLLPGAHEYIRSIGIDVDKVVYIPNGIDFSIYSQPTDRLPKQNSDRFTVMYAGAHGFANCLEVILKCAEILKGKYGDKIVFQLVGDGPQKEYLKNMADKMGLSNVEFINPVPKSQVPTLLSHADAFIVVVKDSPLYKYGISLNKIYDYLASARPVIIGVNAFNNPVEEAGAGITVAPENPEELAAAVIKLYNMSEQDRKQMGINGRKYVEENHDFRNLAVGLEKVLEEAISINKPE